MNKILNTKVEDLIPTIKDYLKEFFSKFSYSVLFWNGILYVAFFVTMFIDLEMAGIVSGIGSILFLACIFDGCDDKDVLWAPLTFLFWFLILVGLFIGAGVYLIIKTIIPFNKWLDKFKRTK